MRLMVAFCNFANAPKNRTFFSVLVDKFRNTGTRDVHRDTHTDICSHNMKTASLLHNNDPIIFLVQIAGWKADAFIQTCYAMREQTKYIVEFAPVFGALI